MPFTCNLLTSCLTRGNPMWELSMFAGGLRHLYVFSRIAPVMCCLQYPTQKVMIQSWTVSPEQRDKVILSDETYWLTWERPRRAKKGRLDCKHIIAIRNQWHHQRENTTYFLPLSHSTALYLIRKAKILCLQQISHLMGDILILTKWFNKYQ